MYCRLIAKYINCKYCAQAHYMTTIIVLDKRTAKIDSCIKIK